MDEERIHPTQLSNKRGKQKAYPVKPGIIIVMTMYAHELLMGQPYYRPTPEGVKSGAVTEFFAGTNELVILLDSPTPKELADLSVSTVMKAGVITSKAGGVVVYYRFGSELYFECPYNAHAYIDKGLELTLPEIVGEVDRLYIRVVVVDSDSGIVVAPVRLVTLHQQTTKAFVSGVMDQLASGHTRASINTENQRIISSGSAKRLMAKADMRKCGD